MGLGTAVLGYKVYNVDFCFSEKQMVQSLQAQTWIWISALTLVDSALSMPRFLLSSRNNNDA